MVRELKPFYLLELLLQFLLYGRHLIFLRICRIIRCIRIQQVLDLLCIQVMILVSSSLFSRNFNFDIVDVRAQLVDHLDE